MFLNKTFVKLELWKLFITSEGLYHKVSWMVILYSSRRAHITSRPYYACSFSPIYSIYNCNCSSEVPHYNNEVCKCDEFPKISTSNYFIVGLKGIVLYFRPYGCDPLMVSHNSSFLILIKRYLVMLCHSTT